MTEQEAIKNVTAYVYMEWENMPQQVIKALDIMKNCTEKQIAKKVTEHNNHAFHLDFVCPTCDNAVYGQPYAPNYCKHCGQKLVFDWGNEDAE